MVSLCPPCKTAVERCQDCGKQATPGDQSNPHRVQDWGGGLLLCLDCAVVRGIAHDTCHYENQEAIEADVEEAREIERSAMEETEELACLHTCERCSNPCWFERGHEGRHLCSEDLTIKPGTTIEEDRNG